MVVLAPFACVTVEAAPNETNAFKNAFNQFQDKLYASAETGFSNFVATYTNSIRLPIAILYQGRARLEQSNYVGAIDLLQRNLAKAGEQGPDYQFWIGRALLKKRDFATAAESQAKFLSANPASPFRLEAALDEAEAYTQLNNGQKVIEVLGKADGAFQTAARQQADNPAAVAGFMLLADAYFQQQRYGDAEKVLTGLRIDSALKRLNWKRQYLLCRIQLIAGRFEPALAGTPHLLAASAGNRQWLADSRHLQGEILEKLGRLADAVQAFTNNLAEDLPSDVQRQALFKTIDLTLKQGLTDDAMKRLENFVETRPKDPALDFARLSLGELNLKAYDAWRTQSIEGTKPSAIGTNLLQNALTNFDRLIVDFPESPLRGKAHLDKGWCCWSQEKIAEAQTNFQEAFYRLPVSEDRAVAQFKLADAQFYQSNYVAALSNYNAILQNYTNVPAVKEGLMDQVLYQIVRAAILCADEASARNAADRIVQSYPNSLFADRAMLLFGQDLNHRRSYAEARKTFSQLLERFPNTSVMPQVQLAIARSYAQENEWRDAAAQYDRWVTNFPQHALLPQAEFSRALAYDKAGLETNALALFTNYVARFPSNSLAPWAQNWVADYQFNHENYVAADRAYQELYLKYPGSTDLAYQAKLMAGRSALARLRPDEAGKYFLELVNDTNTPPSLLGKTFFALGDSLLQQFQEYPKDGGSTNFFSGALAAFSQITNGTPTNALAPLAMGRIGDCYFGWADRRANRLPTERRLRITRPH